ncbi:prepilin-type N-terminal cleavage/methylation domain-containing protein [Candidatus Saccharibacteria bacterium]|nr:prepilin-type N-terminal cleavage/methylation domain-containing protein [Candidatus Saccharibacteria bacterium]
MKKQGFTLIELMVVIVIMGILAAVAVPKLFGMIAKSKASEVGPSAGEYIKLQDAYVAETGVYYGSWELIGFTMPTSSNFTYDGYKGAGAKTSITTAKAGAWTAQPKATLNDCPTTALWKINIAANSSTGGSVIYNAALTDQTHCLSLTPNFAAFSSDRTTLAAN